MTEEIELVMDAFTFPYAIEYCKGKAGIKFMYAQSRVDGYYDAKFLFKGETHEAIISEIFSFGEYMGKQKFM